MSATSRGRRSPSSDSGSSSLDPAPPKSGRSRGSSRRGRDEMWCNKEVPDVEHPRPKFEPKHPVGPRIDTAVAWTPLSLFKLFFSSSVQCHQQQRSTTSDTRHTLQVVSPLHGQFLYFSFNNPLFWLSPCAHKGRLLEERVAIQLHLPQELHDPGQI